MKKILRISLIVMSIVTVITAIAIGVVVYANANSSGYTKVVLAADELTTQPSSWKTLEELGIIEIKEQDGWLQVIVPKEKAKQLQAERPAFKYEDKFYQISPFWVTPGLPNNMKQGIIVTVTGLGIGWIFVGALYFQNRKNKRKNTTSLGKALLIALLCLSITLVPVSLTPVSASSEELSITPGMPDEVRNSEPKPLNYTDSYLNTTSPNADVITPESWSDEIDDVEGSNPLYVLVIADEEEREVWRSFPWDDNYVFRTWIEWAQVQIERGDESLVSKYDIDIRILGFEQWDSNDNPGTMEDLWYELESEKKQYIGQWYDGTYWHDYVDAIIGITAQSTTNNVMGLSPGDEYVDQGKIIILLKWQVHWIDDNLVQHETSHLYYLQDHYDTDIHCVMAQHAHFQTFILEDAIWIVFNDIWCSLTSFDWSTTCNGIINTYKTLYANNNYMLAVRHGDPYNPKGTLSPGAGVYTYGSPTSVSISGSGNPGYYVSSWLVDGATTQTGNPMTINVNDKRSVAANWAQGTGVGGTLIPINKLKVLAPYIGVTAVISIATILSIVFIKRRKKER